MSGYMFNVHVRSCTIYIVLLIQWVSHLISYSTSIYKKYVMGSAAVFARRSTRSVLLLSYSSNKTLQTVLSEGMLKAP